MASVSGTGKSPILSHSQFRLRWFRWIVVEIFDGVGVTELDNVTFSPVSDAPRLDYISHPLESIRI